MLIWFIFLLPDHTCASWTTSQTLPTTQVYLFRPSPTFTHLRLCFSFQCAQAVDWQSAKSIYEFSAFDIDGNETSLEKYRWTCARPFCHVKSWFGQFIKALICFPFFFFFPRGKVCIIVNVASKWGKTRVNYTQLVEMHASYAEKGLSILGFPCNQFGGQASSSS